MHVVEMSYARGKCATAFEIDFARTSYHSPCKVAWTHFFPFPFHFGGNYFCWRAVCDVYLPTGGWNDSESEFEPGQSLRENQPPPFSLSLSFSLFFSLVFNVIAFSFSPFLARSSSSIPFFLSYTDVSPR